ncbi:hypothetical protein GCM10010394_02600 [Streptomyces crystallinus]|uniref:Uncharacterized protein n=1 Tax=Streptomyces crystallinus TaxID=68191 RepID=A0ABP3Q132_9ACTN
MGCRKSAAEGCGRTVPAPRQLEELYALPGPESTAADLIRRPTRRGSGPDPVRARAGPVSQASSAVSRSEIELMQYRWSVGVG